MDKVGNEMGVEGTLVIWKQGGCGWVGLQQWNCSKYGYKEVENSANGVHESSELGKIFQWIKYLYCHPIFLELSTVDTSGFVISGESNTWVIGWSWIWFGIETEGWNSSSRDMLKTGCKHFIEDGSLSK